MSIFLGDELTAVLKSIEEDTYFGEHQNVQLETGAHVLPHFVKDNTDRNRTSPFAFTGNKFEFRMLGSSASVATPNIILKYRRGGSSLPVCQRAGGNRAGRDEHAVHELIKRAVKKHKKVYFQRKRLHREWIEEAKKRGLYNLVSTPDLPAPVHCG